MYKKLISSTLIVFVLGGLASAVGLLKEMIVAEQFGLGSQVDVFFLGLSFPMFLAGLTGAAISAAVLPGYIQAQKNNTRQTYVPQIATLIVVLMLTLTCVSWLFSFFIQPYVGDLTDSERHLVMWAGVFLSPLIILQGLSSLMDGVLNSEGKVAINNGSAILVPLGTMVVLACFAEKDFWMLCVGLYLGMLSKLLIQLSVFFRASVKSGMTSFRFYAVKAAFQANKNVIKDFGWVLVSSAVLGLLPVISNYYVSYFSEGSVAGFNYANKLLASGLTITNIAINAVLFPYISKAVIYNRDRGVKQGTWLAWLSVIVSTIMLVPIYFFADPIVSLIFQRGHFSADAAGKVAGILKYLLLYVPFYIGGAILSRLVIALNISRLFLAGNIISLLIFLTACFLLFEYTAIGVKGLGISYLAVYFVSFVYMFVCIQTCRSDIKNQQIQE